MSISYPISATELEEIRKSIHSELRNLLVTRTTLPISTTRDGKFVNASLLEERIVDITRLITDFALGNPAQEEAFKHSMADQRVAFSGYISKNFDTQEGINIFDYLETKTHLKLYETLSQKLFLGKANQDWVDIFTKKHKPDYSITWKEHIEGLETSVDAMQKTFPGYPGSFDTLPPSQKAELMQTWRTLAGLIIDDKYKQTLFGGYAEAIREAESDLLLLYKDCRLSSAQAKSATKNAYNAAKSTADNLRPRFPPKTDEKILIDVRAYSGLVEAILKQTSERIGLLQVQHNRGGGMTPLSVAKSSGSFLSDPNYLMEDLAHTIAMQAVRENLHNEAADSFAARLKAHQKQLGDAFNKTGVAGVPGMCQMLAHQFAQECIAVAWPACKEHIHTNMLLSNAIIKKEAGSFAQTAYKALVGNRLDCTRDDRLDEEKDDIMYVQMQKTRNSIKMLMTQAFSNLTPNNTYEILHELAGRLSSKNDELLEFGFRFEELHAQFMAQNKLHTRLGYSRLESQLSP